MKAPASFDSQASAAASLRVELEEIRQAKRDGCAAFKSGRVYQKPLVAWLRKRGILQKSFSFSAPPIPQPRPDSEHPPSYWKAKEAQLRCERLQIQVDKESGALVSVSDTNIILGQMHIHMRDFLLRRPYRLVDRLVSAKSADEVIELLVADNARCSHLFMDFMEDAVRRTKELAAKQGGPAVPVQWPKSPDAEEAA